MHISKNVELENRIFNDLNNMLNSDYKWLINSESYFILDQLIAFTGKYSDQNRVELFIIIEHWKTTTKRKAG